MTATEVLRRMLDERGARWTACSKATIDNQTYCYGHTYTEYQSGLMVTDLTPAQAIAATLGAGTCHITDNGPWGYPYVCSACGASFDPDVNNGEFNYCPNCGRRCVG